jgi:WD40 repeat protein
MNARSAMHRSFQNSKRRIFLALTASIGLAGQAAAQGPRVTELTSFTGTRHHSGRMAFSPDGKTIALPKPAKRRVEIWNIETGKVQYVESQFGKEDLWASDVAFSRDGRFLASGFQTGGFAICELARPKEQIRIPISESTTFVGMSFDETSRKLVTVTGAKLDSGLVRYSSARRAVATGKKEEFHDFYPGLRFETLSPDGHYVLLQNGNQQIAFDSGTGKQMLVIESFGNSRFSNDVSMLVSYDGERVARWAVPSGKKLDGILFESSRKPPGYGMTDRFAVSPKNKLLAIAGFAKVNVVALVSLESGKVLDTFECCPPLMFCSQVCFSPNGRILATDTEEYDQKDNFVDPLLKFWKVPDEW